MESSTIKALVVAVSGVLAALVQVLIFRAAKKRKREVEDTLVANEEQSGK